MDRPWEEVRDSSYFRDVLANLRGRKSGSVLRFGIGGEGVAPNYQIWYANGEVVAYNGLSRRADIRSTRYDETKLSEEFTYAEVPWSKELTLRAGQMLPSAIQVVDGSSLMKSMSTRRELASEFQSEEFSHAGLRASPSGLREILGARIATRYEFPSDQPDRSTRCYPRNGKSG